MSLFSELLFKIKFLLNKDNNTWKENQVQKTEKDIENIKSSIKETKKQISNKIGNFESLEKNLKSQVIKLRPDLSKEFEKYIKQCNDFLFIINKINRFELKNNSDELKNLYDLSKAKKALLTKEWQRLDQLGSSPPKETKGIEKTIISKARTLPPVIRKGVMDILKAFEEIEIIQSSIKAHNNNILKLKQRISSLREKKSFEPAYSH